jgi:hypothetical protein
LGSPRDSFTAALQACCLSMRHTPTGKEFIGAAGR